MYSKPLMFILVKRLSLGLKTDNPLVIVPTQTLLNLSTCTARISSSGKLFGFVFWLKKVLKTWVSILYKVSPFRVPIHKLLEALSNSKAVISSLKILFFPNSELM